MAAVTTDAVRAGHRSADDELVAGWVVAAERGDQQAWRALVDRFDGLLWSIARSFRLEQPDASDVVQTTWLRLLEHVGTLEHPERVGGWLATTVRNECLALLRRQARGGVSIEASDDLVSQLPSVDQPLLTNERDVELWQALLRLPDLCRRLLRVFSSDPPPSYQEVAVALDMPIGSIGPRRGRCLDQLRQQLQLGTGGAR